MTFLRLAALTAVLATAAWLAHALSGTPLVGYDDANIFFVYARNLVDGHGFVFNAGGERVEGFTSLLWLLICAMARVITPRFEILLVVINVAVGSVALWWLHRFITDRLRSPIAAFALVAAVSLTPGFVVWNVLSLMDSGLWSAVFLIAAVVVVRSAFDRDREQTQRTLPILLIVLALTRPESLLLGPALIAASMIVAAGGSTDQPLRTRELFKSHLPSIVAFTIATVALLAWRLAYFGFPLPNTYYATVEPLNTRVPAGFDYFSDFGQHNPLALLALAAGVLTTDVAYRRCRATGQAEARSLFGAQAGLLTLMVISSAIVIVEGGDRFGFSRLLQPVAALAAMQAVLTAMVIAAVNPALPAQRTIVVAILLALVPWRHWAALDQTDYASPTTAKGIWNTPQVEISIAADMRGIGAAFTRAFPDVKPTVGVIVAGGFAFAYDGPTIDLMGHNHVAMAHAPGPRGGPRGEMSFNHDVFNALSPDVVLLSRWSPARDWFALPMLSGDYDRPAHLTPDYFPKRAASMRIFDYGVMKGLLLSSNTGQRYVWASVRPQGGDRWVHAIFNRVFLKRLEGRGYEIVFATPPSS